MVEMKKAKYLKQMRERSEEELMKEIILLSKSLFSARVRIASGQLKDVNHLRRLSLSIARVKTVLTEKARV